jgi:hypothetical protein
VRKVRSANLFVLYKQSDGAAALDVAPSRNRNTAVRTFTNRKAAINYARPYGALIVHLFFPGEGHPIITEIIDPSKEPTT